MSNEEALKLLQDILEKVSHFDLKQTKRDIMEVQDYVREINDFEEHNKQYHYYCEVVIFPNGDIEYAIPSHQEKLISLYMERTGKTRSQCEEEWIKDTYWLDKVRKEIGIIYVWYGSYDDMCVDVTKEQVEALKKLNAYKCTNFIIRKELLERYETK